MIINSPPILPSTTPLAWWVGRLIVLLCLAMPMVPVLAQTSDPFAPLTTDGQQTQAGIMKILNYLAWFGLLGVVFMAFYGKGKFPIGWAAVIVAAILISGIPWMFVVSRILSWADIQYYTKQKGRRIPFLSDWLDRLWLRMIESRRPKSPTSGSSE